MFGGGYIRDANLVTYLGGVGGAYIQGVGGRVITTGFYGLPET